MRGSDMVARTGPFDPGTFMRRDPEPASIRRKRDWKREEGGQRPDGGRLRRRGNEDRTRSEESGTEVVGAGFCRKDR